MKVLVLGGGGREHALAWAVARSAAVETVFVAPGNPGTAREPKVSNVDIGVSDVDRLADFAEANVELTIVGPEAPLAAGVVDVFAARGLRCFGPSAQAAQIESSKGFAKALMAEFGVPTGFAETFTDYQSAERYIRAQGAPIVVKADGLAEGKGVVVAQTVDVALDAARRMLSGEAFGDAGREILVEEFLGGEEASFICVCDGTNVVPMATSQDHKPRDDGDTGPNTGGMGAYSPAPVVTAELHQRVMEEVIHPVVRGMASRGTPYVGFLYAGLMIQPDDSIKVIEFNCRFGDPEAQPVLSRLRSDLVELCGRALDGQLAGYELDWDPRVALGVVMACGGYPDAYAKGDVIHGLGAIAGEVADQRKVFHAGTAEVNDQIVTNGGRVLCVVGLGDTTADAQREAYAGVAEISWDKHFCRGDIGYRAVAREQTA